MNKGATVYLVLKNLIYVVVVNSVTVLLFITLLLT